MNLFAFYAQSAMTVIPVRKPDTMIVFVCRNLFSRPVSYDGYTRASMCTCRFVYRDHAGTMQSVSMYTDHVGTMQSVSMYRDHVGTMQSVSMHRDHVDTMQSVGMYRDHVGTMQSVCTETM